MKTKHICTLFLALFTATLSAQSADLLRPPGPGLSLQRESGSPFQTLILTRGTEGAPGAIIVAWQIAGLSRADSVAYTGALLAVGANSTSLSVLLPMIPESISNSLLLQPFVAHDGLGLIAGRINAFSEIPVVVATGDCGRVERCDKFVVDSGVRADVDGDVLTIRIRAENADSILCARHMLAWDRDGTLNLYYVVSAYQAPGKPKMFHEEIRVGRAIGSVKFYFAETNDFDRYVEDPTIVPDSSFKPQNCPQYR